MLTDPICTTGKIGQLFGEWSLFAGMKLAVHRKEDVEIARQPSGYAVVDANRILTDDRRVDLPEIARLHTIPKDRPILFKNCLEKARRVSYSALTLHVCKPTVGVYQTVAPAQRETVSSRVS